MDTLSYLRNIDRKAKTATGLKPSCLMLCRCDKELGVVVGESIGAENDSIILQTCSYVRMNLVSKIDVKWLDKVTVYEQKLWYVFLNDIGWHVRWPSKLPYEFSLIKRDEYIEINKHVRELQHYKIAQFVGQKFRNKFTIGPEIFEGPVGYAAEEQVGKYL